MALMLRRLGLARSHSGFMTVLRLGENLSSERLNPCAVTPCIGGQPGLDAGLFKELLTLPVPLSGNLR